MMRLVTRSFLKTASTPTPALTPTKKTKYKKLLKKRLAKMAACVPFALRNLSLDNPSMNPTTPNANINTTKLAWTSGFSFRTHVPFATKLTISCKQSKCICFLSVEGIKRRMKTTMLFFT